MLKADRMKFRVNVVMDGLPLVFSGLTPVGRSLPGSAAFHWRRLAWGPGTPAACV